MESAEERVTLHSNSTSKMREGAWTEQLKLLAQEAHGSVVYGAGTRIFEEADVGKTAFFIEEGYVELSKLVNGKKTRVATIGPGEIFGEMATLDGHARSASAVALHDTVLIPFTRAQLDAIVQSEHPLFQVLLRTALERLRTVQEENSPCDAPTAPPPKSINWAQRQVTEHIKLRVALERAIAKSELELLYQPIVQLRDGTVAGFEALVRWPGAPEGYSGPAQFIPFAERTGLILPMGEWILQTALRGMQRLNGGKSTWRKQQRAVFMSVNISPEQIASSDNLERLISIIKDGDADPSQLKLEITEGTMLNDTEMALESLSRLRDTGASLAIDDFGTGYSSLSYLSRFPLDVLKIDRSFISALTGERKGARIVNAILSLAQELELDVVAEGIEQHEEAQWLRERGCAYGQGYLFGRPLRLPEAIIQLPRLFR